jgi:hypothetical protein
MEKHCSTCMCWSIHQIRVDKHGIVLSRDHELCPVCEVAVARKLLKQLGGVCQTCQRTAYVRKKGMVKLKRVV